MFSVIEHVPRLESLALLPGAATSLMNTHVAAFIGSCRKSVALVSHLRDRGPGARHEHRKFIGQFFTADTQKRRWFVIEILDSVALVYDRPAGQSRSRGKSYRTMRRETDSVRTTPLQRLWAGDAPIPGARRRNCNLEWR